MEITGNKTEAIKITVDPRDALHLLERSEKITTKDALAMLKMKLMQSFKVREWRIDDDGHWWHTENSGGYGHYDFDEEIKGKAATTTEKFIWASVQAIEKEVLDLEP